MNGDKIFDIMYNEDNPLENDPYKRVHQIRRGLKRFNKDGSFSTHMMASGEHDGKYYAHPMLFPIGTSEEGIEWKEFPATDEGFRNAYYHAKRIGEIFEFDTEKEAVNFAKGNWK